MNKHYKGIRRITEKWANMDKSIIAVVVIVVAMFGLSWFTFGYHLSDVSQKYRQIISDAVTAEIDNSCTKIESVFEKKSSIISNMAKRLSQMEVVEDDALSFAFAEVKSMADYVEVIYVDALGKEGHTDSGKIKDPILTEYIDKYDGLSDFCIIDNYKGLCGSTNSYVVISPVKREQRIYGYAIGISEYDLGYIQDNLKYEIEGDVVVINDAGVIVSLVQNGEIPEIKHENVFFDILAANVSPTDFDGLVNAYEECLRTGEGTTYDAVSAGSNIKYIFERIYGTGKWCMVHCIREESILKIVNDMLVTSVIVFVFIVIFMTVAAMAVISHIRKAQEKVASLEYLDGLTGIMNRNAFTSKAEEILRENKNIPFYIACMDIVNFRIINETYGHERSDVIIKALADGCKEAFGKNEIYGRLNADVFVALAVNDNGGEERTAFLENKVREAAKTVYINHPIKLKRGYYEVVDYNEGVSRMIDKANIARKYINANSKELFCTYSDELMEGARKTEFIESQMESALANHEFKPYLQAKWDMEKNHVCGAEALVRWQKPDGSLVPPGDFIPLFESNGFIEKVDFYMLEEICKYLRKMIDENRAVYPVSVNQSRYLLNDPDYVSKVKDILLRYEIPIGLIELELTETVFFHERERMISMMNELKYIHVNLSIDDFGSGYSSFNLLKDVPFDVLKIDREFLSASTHSERSQVILQKIVDMAHSLGMSVICEGVETREQSEMLMSIGCSKAQGFLYARPIPMSEYIDKFNIQK